MPVSQKMIWGRMKMAPKMMAPVMSRLLESMSKMLPRSPPPPNMPVSEDLNIDWIDRPSLFKQEILAYSGMERKGTVNVSPS